MPNYKRKRKLIEPRLQMKFALTFFTTAGIGVFCLTLLFGYMIDKAARSLPNDGSLLLSQLPFMLRDCLLLTGVILVPLTLAIGIHATFRVVGPMYRFRIFLNDVIAGKQTTPCRIREGDELHDFCDLLNRVTEQQRAQVEAQDAAREPAIHEPDSALPRSHADELVDQGA